MNSKMNKFCSCNEIYTEEQTALISNEFKRIEGQCYLEHAGSTLYSDQQIKDVFTNLSENLYSNPHAKNTSSKSTEDIIDIIRYEILSQFETNPEEYSLIFTSSATAALKLVGESFRYENPEGTQNGTFVYLQDNHTSVLGMREFSKSMKCLEVEKALETFLNHDRSDFIREQTSNCNSLFAYPAQSNFSGRKYPLTWIEHVKKGLLNTVLSEHCRNWYTFLDAASYASTNKLDLSIYKPDFVAISFYKIFGYPTGLGALLVNHSAAHTLRKKYFSGGTIFMAQALDRTVIPRDILHERFEDGSLSFLSIVALKQGFQTIKRLNLNFEAISQHTFSLAQYVYRNLICLHHSNGKPIATLYHGSTFQDSHHQGGIVNFNLLRDNGEFVGYSEILHFANLYGIYLRTGCFCNPGACQYFLKLTPEDVNRFYEAGHVCGDQNDLVEGIPTGSVRISFGYMSTKEDADKFLEMIEDCFASGPIIKRIPSNYKIIENAINKDTKAANANNTSQSRKALKEINCFKSLFFRNENSSEFGVLQQIFLYPIKSCGAFAPTDKWPLTTTGLKYDRQWMIVNSAGACFTQKHNKKLCLISPVIDLDHNKLILTFPDCKEIRVPLDNTMGYKNEASLCQSKVCGDKIQGWDCGDEVSDWLVYVLDSPGLRLLKQCSEEENIMARTSRKNDSLALSLANKAQYLLLNVASIEWLREKIPKEEFDEGLETTLLRFRPNFVVSFSRAFLEDDYGQFTFQNKKFDSAGKCTRCQMICIDQKTGDTSKEPLQTLSREYKGKISFGVYLNRNEFIAEDYLQVGCKVTAKGKIN